MKMTSEDHQVIFDYLETFDVSHFKEGMVTLLVAYFQDNVEMGMHTCLDKKFYSDMESLFNILSVREKYTDEK
jgi:hypothetical protein